MSEHEHTVVVDLPVRVVYDQWTQMESYSEFMDDVDWVKQLDDSHTRWHVTVGGISREYDATIDEQVPDKLLRWSSTDGVDLGGRVSFEPAGEHATKVTLMLSFEPQDLTERVGDKLGVVSSASQNSLERFKAFLEDRGRPTGTWRGQIHDGSVQPAPADDEGTTGYAATATQ